MYQEMVSSLWYTWEESAWQKGQVMVEGAEGKEGECYLGRQEVWWLLGSKFYLTPSSTSGTPDVGGGSYQMP